MIIYNNERVIILAILIPIMLFIFIKGFYKCKKNNEFYIKYDILSKNYNFTSLKIFDNYLDGWAISHFILYFILAYIYPSEWIFILLCGILWEILEYIFSFPFFNYDCKYNNTDVKYNNWWYAQYEDIVMNILGISLALLIRHFTKK